MGNICFLLDGTLGIQCQFEGPYQLSRNRPSMAFIGRGVPEREHGTLPVIDSTPILYCEPAFQFNAHRGLDDALSVEWVIQQQQSCTKFRERK